ncbi:MAG: hypothetical protein WAU45_14260 [Blastocatellia bacterium]
MKDVPDDRVSVYVIWDPIFGGSFDHEAKKLSGSFPDRRVSYFKDPSSLAGNLWERVLQTQNQSEIAWDVYLLYGADARWENEPQQPAYWMHQLWGVAKAPRLDVPTFTAKLKDMLGEIKTSNANEAANTNDRARIEFLYFKECPAHKQALANLKAVLRESGRRADVALISVTSEQQAERVGFQGSPSIRVNGTDLDGRNEGHSYGCRVYQIGGKMTAVPTKEFIREKLSRLRLLK